MGAGVCAWMWMWWEYLHYRSSTHAVRKGKTDTPVLRGHLGWAAEGEKRFVLFMTPRRSGQGSVESWRARPSNGPKQRGPPAWIDRYQRIWVQFPGGHRILVCTCHSLAA